MKITDIVVFPVNGNSRLRAYVNVTFDRVFLVHELKILQSGNGKLFVVMPDKKITDNCTECGKPCPLVDEYCGGCGLEIGAVNKQEDKGPLHEDICHPISNHFREELQAAVIDAYHRELDKRSSGNHILVKGKS
jgi:DNA-binding cell septation regulator SpoVG